MKVAIIGATGTLQSRSSRTAVSTRNHTSGTSESGDVR